MNYTWSVRVRAESKKSARVHARNHSFRVGPALSFEPSDELPSALEHLLGALASDLATTFWSYAKRRRIFVEAIELSLNCQLQNPLMHLGVLGAEGSPAIESISGVFYASVEAESDEAVQSLWEQTLAASPIYSTLSRAAQIKLRFQPTD